MKFLFSQDLDLAVGIENTPIRLNPVEFPTADESIVKELNAAKSILQKIFGYPKFRQGQKEIIKNISEKHDVIALLPTGGGKTVIYVIAGMILSGITFVVQPIKSLMEEQVRSLREKGVTSFFINSYYTDQEVIQIVSALRSPSIRYAIVFISPEKIISKTVQDLLQTLSHQNRLNLFAVDEAQCVDLWGGSFRESYKDLGFLKSFNVPIVALSGSATDRTISVIRDRLGLVDPVVKRTSFARTNLHIKIVKKTDKPVAQIVQIVENHYPGQCGIIYCSKRPSTKDIAYALKAKGISATHVDGKLKDLEKRRNENLWKKNQASVICATKCFGMGIDKGDVRFVLHFEMPDSIEDYYQQIGRGRRHGDDADCILLFSVKDRSFHIQSIMSKKDSEEIEYRQKNLNSMTNFCMQLQSCRHVVILNHFGEDCEPCGQKCDICKSALKEIDRTEEAKIILNCFVKMRAESAEVTVDLLCLTLLGSKSQALKTKKFDENQYFGTGKTFQGCKGRDAKVIIQTLIYKLIFSNVLIERCKTQTLNQRRAAEARTVASLYLDTGELGPLYEGKIQIMS